MPKLARITIYPVKSLDPQQVERAVLLASGALQHDRRFALVDRQDQFIGGKRTAAVHRLRTVFEPASDRLTLHVTGESEPCTFDVYTQRRELEQWLSDFFSEPVELVEDAAAGFPDDVASPGPTLVSTATLAEVASWFEGMTVDEARGRFRANLEVAGVEPFWEDRLVADGDRAIRFRIGQAELFGTNPCQRCVVPTRDPRTGEATREFAKLFARHRQELLPPWAPPGRFDHFLSIGTQHASGAVGQVRASGGR